MKIYHAANSAYPAFISSADSAFGAYDYASVNYEDISRTAVFRPERDGVWVMESRDATWVQVCLSMLPVMVLRQCQDKDLPTCGTMCADNRGGFT